MKAKLLLALVLGLLSFGMPTWALSAATSRAALDNSIASALGHSDTQSFASVPGSSGADFSDTLPLATIRLSRSKLSVGIALLAQETVVTPTILDGAGVMLTFRAAPVPWSRAG